MSAGIVLLIFTYSAHQTTNENLLKTWLILEIKFDLELTIFKVKGVFLFCLLFVSYSARENTYKYPLKPSSQMRQIFYIALYIACGAGRYIDQQSGRGPYLRYPVILCINFASHKRSIFTEISVQLKG